MRGTFISLLIGFFGLIQIAVADIEWTAIDAMSGRFSLVISADGKVNAKCETGTLRVRNPLGKLEPRELKELNSLIEASRYCTRKGFDTSAISMYELKTRKCVRKFTLNFWRYTTGISRVYSSLESVKAKFAEAPICGGDSNGF